MEPLTVSQQGCKDTAGEWPHPQGESRGPASVFRQLPWEGSVAHNKGGEEEGVAGLGGEGGVLTMGCCTSTLMMSS